MRFPAATVHQVAASGDADAVDGLFRRVLAGRVPGGINQPRWIAGRELTGVFSGYGAVRDFADWCDAFGADAEFEFGPPPEVVLFCRTDLGGYAVTVSCVADERDAGVFFRLNPGWGLD
ncbi:hypothetical protein GCM10027447_34790 [Glycomyces halotolerans]